MAPDEKRVTVLLDRHRPVRWSNRAAARNSSLARPGEFTALAKPKRALYAMCAILWAALVDRDHPFEAPEDLAEYLETEAQHLAALEAIGDMVKQAFPEKKSPPSSEPSAPGQPPSLTAGSVAPPSTGGS